MIADGATRERVGDSAACVGLALEVTYNLQSEEIKNGMLQLANGKNITVVTNCFALGDPKRTYVCLFLESRGEVKVLCIPDFICDVIVGNVEGARGPEDPEMSVIVRAATTRIQALREKATRPLRVPAVERRGGVDGDQLMSFNKRIRHYKDMEGTTLPGVVILTDCQSLVRKLSGTGSAEVGTALQLAEELMRVENVRIIVQWLPSHVGIRGNETADKLGNQGRNQQQPNNPVTLTQVAHLLRRKTAALWEAASGSYDDRTQKLNEARRAGDYIGVLDRCDAVQLFRVRAGHSLLRSDMFRRKWSATTVCRLCGEENEDCSHVLVSCGELRGIRETDWSDITLQEALWGSKENMVRAARLLRVFISRATR
ncbi:RNA-directed DNA polymerase from [Plakobranchus ocellatus]|uniref:RNA-directed DNA polymerase from n=1 Tax=Plakobranchus ocellatus TaxID=259542 RepID=A0AAV4DKQ5_9GAST|nr:RNA-directed DNA polymerase from [Plakobranchus ocellatus]